CGTTTWALWQMCMCFAFSRAFGWRTVRGTKMEGIGGVLMNHCRRIGTLGLMYLGPVLMMLTMSCKFLPFGLGGDSTPKPPSPHEPSGFDEVANRGFDNLTENDWIFGGDATAYAELNDDAAPESKPHIGRVTMPV